jgi:4-carboxymuconolactone decarboxylase
MPVLRTFLSLATVAMAATSGAQERLPTIPPASYSADQRLAAMEFEAARKTPVFGPFEPLMYSPTVMNDARALGDYLRYKPSIGTTLSELVILVTAREWSQDYEWFVHYPLALKAGIRADVADAIGEGRHAPALNGDEAIVYDFTTELHHGKGVSDATFARAEKRFGKQGVVDLTAISGYYTLLAMELNVAHYKVPEGGRTLPQLAKGAVVPAGASAQP